MSYKVNIKWGKEKFESIELNTTEPPELFRAQVMTLTGVEPDRQKVMLKGTTLKETWDDFKRKGLKDGSAILLMGSATALPQAPTEKTVFSEDMSEQQLASAMKMPSGLVNLGNTCYMNATIQCLRSIPELSNSLKTYVDSGQALVVNNSMGRVTKEMSQLVKMLESSSTAVTPLMFLQELFLMFPQFAEKGEHGGFTQQDANECWVELVRCLQQSLGGPSHAATVIDQYMRIEFNQSIKCVESEEEPQTSLSETMYQLSCFIDQEVKYMQTGLQNRMKEHISKNSVVLGRDAMFEKQSKISRLPAYLSIQFVRFFYKDKKGINAKILKDVKFSLVLDMFELCTPELQERLTPMRLRMKEEEDKVQDEVVQAKLKGTPLKTKRKTDIKSFSFEDDPGSNNSGFYELQAVLTHKGRSSSSGHYVGWVRQSGDTWIMYDDDNVVQVKAEDILKLSGGGDWHSAYVLLYKPKTLEVVVRGENNTEEAMQE